MHQRQSRNRAKCNLMAMAEKVLKRKEPKPEGWRKRWRELLDESLSENDDLMKELAKL